MVNVLTPRCEDVKVTPSLTSALRQVDGSPCSCGLRRWRAVMCSVEAGMSQTLALSLQAAIQLRFLAPEDIPEVKQLCAQWFPIDYPETWFEDITSNRKFYSLAAMYSGKIIGMIVAEVKTRSRCNREDADLLASHFPPSTQMAYILSLGVQHEFRRNGMASLLLDSLVSHLTSAEHYNVKAIYLHVLTTNDNAINFYEHRSFTQHSFLPYYYSIQGSPRDGYSYVLYINGGQPPWAMMDYVRYWGSIVMQSQPCACPKRLLQSLQKVWHRTFKGVSARLSPVPTHLS